MEMETTGKMLREEALLFIKRRVGKINIDDNDLGFVFRYIHFVKNELISFSDLKKDFSNRNKVDQHRLMTNLVNHICENLNVIIVKNKNDQLIEIK